MANLFYSLDDKEEIVSRPATESELSTARATAKTKLKAVAADWAMRSCWNCNPAHAHFLSDASDDFLFSCIMGCGRWFYNGIDITEDKPGTVSQPPP